jgi:hypothetical protein
MVILPYSEIDECYIGLMLLNQGENFPWIGTISDYFYPFIGKHSYHATPRRIVIFENDHPYSALITIGS